MLTFYINFINSYGHIVKSIEHKCKTEKQAVSKAKKEKFLYPECYIEILCYETRKRIYA